MRLLGVLDGRDMAPELLRAWAESAEFVIAADGAADRLLEAGVRPNLIIGDMDGMTRDAEGVEILTDSDPESTDCDKLLRWVRREGHSNLTLANIEGDLLDHVMATLSSCAAFGRTVRIALRRGIGWVFTGPLKINVDPHARVSLIPITPCSGVKLHGVQWRLDNADLHPGGRVSISNAATDGFVQATIVRGTGFLFAEYPREEMPFWD
ncbi:MAG TPA: thiamine diphosphokinase [Fimbriimonadaceae bacterium]|nr:thiamine diphosphokinase [Fimbriimonadaceae bacterium]